jgi:iron complex outermembrane receptor protein
MAMHPLRTTALALAAAASTWPLCPAWAQTTVVVSGRSLAGAGVTGLGDTPLAQAPLQASIVGQQQLADAGIASIGALTKTDASLSDAYNADGYWASLRCVATRWTTASTTGVTACPSMPRP